jgi:Fic family protein
MDMGEFKSERVGTLELVPNTVFHFFLPKKLPFKIEYSAELVKLISDASLSLGNLDEAGKKLHNPHLFITPYLKKEAVLSSKIEGTKTTLSEVFEKDSINKKHVDDDLGEVLNYIEALYEGLRRIQTEKISVSLIKDLHKILLSGVRGENKNPGRFKQDLNWIGSSYDVMEAKFVPCIPNYVEDLINNLVVYLNDDSFDAAIVKIGIAHYQFETIHPFQDGNGRMGRLLIILYLCQEKIIEQPLFYLSAFFEKYKKDYDSLLKQVSTDGDLEGWLKFFLTGVRVQAMDAVLRAEQLEVLREKYRGLLLQKTKSMTALTILEFLFENPVVTIPMLQKKLNCHYPKAQYNVEILMDAGILKTLDKTSGEKRFVAMEILGILNKS